MNPKDAAVDYLPDPAKESIKAKYSLSGRLAAAIYRRRPSRKIFWPLIAIACVNIASFSMGSDISSLYTASLFLLVAYLHFERCGAHELLQQPEEDLIKLGIKKASTEPADSANSPSARG